MPVLVTSLVFAVLVVTIPFTLVLKVLLQLPKPLAPAHRRWPLPLNFALIALMTAYVTIFVRNVYFGRRASPLEFAAEFLIIALAYGFGLVLLMRQFSGVYPEFIVTSGFAGLGLRKTIYRNIRKVEQVDEAAGETQFRIETARGGALSLSLPTRYVSTFRDQMRKMRDEDSNRGQ